MAIDFQVNLQDPQNQIKERAGTPAVDHSGLLKDVEAGGQAIGDVFSGIKKGQDNSIAADAAKTYVDSAVSNIAPAVQAINTDPQLKALGNTAMAVKQGTATPLELSIKNLMIQKYLNDKYAGHEDIVAKASADIMDKGAYHDYQQALLQPYQDSQEQQKALIHSAVEKGTVVVDKNNQIDKNASIQALIQHNASEARATALTQQYENGKHTQEMYETQMGAEITNNLYTTAARSFQNVMNSPELAAINANPNKQARDDAKTNLFSYWQGQYENSTNEQIARMGSGVGQGPSPNGVAGVPAPTLSLTTQNSIREQRTSMIAGFKKLMLDEVDSTKAVHNLAEAAKDNGVVNDSELYPQLFLLNQSFGNLLPSIYNQPNNVTKGPLSGLSDAATGQGESNIDPNTGAELPPKPYSPPSQKFMNNISFTAKLATNPDALHSSVLGGNSEFIPTAVNVARMVVANSNELTPNQDRVFNTVHQNLTNLALSQDMGTPTGKLGSYQDLMNNVKEVTKPLYINAILTSKAKQYNPIENAITIGNTIDATNKGFTVASRLLSKYADNGNIQIDPNTGYLYFAKTTASETPGVKGIGSTLGLLGKPTLNPNSLINENIKTYNQMLDAYIKLKPDTPYAGNSDAKIKEIMNRNYFPQLAQPSDEQGGGQHTPQKAAPTQSGGLTVSVPGKPSLAQRIIDSSQGNSENDNSKILIYDKKSKKVIAIDPNSSNILFSDVVAGRKAYEQMQLDKVNPASGGE